MKSVYISAILLMIVLWQTCFSQTVIPAKNATNVCVDMQFKLTFSTTPQLQNSGTVKLFKGNGTMVASIDLSAMPTGTPSSATWPWTETLNGNTIRVMRAVVDGPTAIFTFPIGSMAYGTSYYITVDQSVFSNSASLGFSAITAGQWSFTVKAKPTSDLDYTVDASGLGDFATLQGALDFIPSGNTSKARIYIKNGTYVGLAFSTGKNNISIEGESANGVILKAFNNSTLNASTHYRSVVNMYGNDLNFVSLSIINTTPNGGTQAEAIKLSGDRIVIVNCRFFSYQDTVLLEGKVYLRDCLIEGDVDFIWGTGTVFFQSCELRANDNGGYNAMARNDNSKHGYAFADCKITRTSTATTTQYLGRDANTTYPYAELVYLNCSMDKHIAAVGWQIRSEMDAALIVFAEYKSVDMTGNLINTSSRHTKSRQLSAAQNTQYRDLNWFFNGWLPVISAPKPITHIYALSSAGATSDWATSANWTPTAVPTAIDTAVIRTGEAKILQDFAGVVKVEPNGLFRITAANVTAKTILLQGGTLKSYTSNPLYALIADITVEKASTIWAGSQATSVFEINGTIKGSGNLTKTYTGILDIKADASAYKGNWIVKNGTLRVSNATALGACGAVVDTALLDVDVAASAYSLVLKPGAKLNLDANLSVEAATIGTVNLAAGTYTAADFPVIISGTGSLIVAKSILSIGTPTAGSISLSSNVGTQHNWSNGNADQANTASYAPATTGAYTVKSSNTVGCAIISAPVSVQVITLTSGWNLISTNIRSTDSAISTLFNGLDVLEIKDMNSYWRKDQPTFLNLLQTITPRNGYLVNMNAGGTLSVAGTQNLQGFINPESLTAGWNLIGSPYLFTHPISPNYDDTNCSEIKNFEGFWIPNNIQNSLDSFEPGNGYYFKK